MSGFNINIEGDLNKKFDKITDEVKKVINKELYDFGEAVVAEAKTLAPVDEGTLRNKIGYDKFDLAVEISVAVNYAAYLEFGTRSFAAVYVASLPPNWQEFAAQFRGKGGGGMEEFVNNLVEWVRRKGIAGVFSVKTHRRTLGKAQQQTDDYAAAYAIALSIIRKGIRPHPFLYPAVESNLIKLKERLKSL